MLRSELICRAASTSILLARSLPVQSCFNSFDSPSLLRREPECSGCFRTFPKVLGLPFKLSETIFLFYHTEANKVGVILGWEVSRMPCLALCSARVKSSGLAFNSTKKKTLLSTHLFHFLLLHIIKSKQDSKCCESERKGLYL